MISFSKNNIHGKKLSNFKIVINYMVSRTYLQKNIFKKKNLNYFSLKLLKLTYVKFSHTTLKLLFLICL